MGAVEPEALAEEDAAAEKGMQAIAAMGDADLDAELRRYGVDPGEVAASALAAGESSVTYKCARREHRNVA